MNKGKNNGITLIALVITIVVLIILAGVAITLSLGENGIFKKAQFASNETIKQTATEKINLKITNIQMEKYAQKQTMPTLQELADGLCEDEEVQYVSLNTQNTASLDKVIIGDSQTIYTKLRDYPYEFGINSSLQLASIDGIKVATTNTTNSTIELDYANKVDISSSIVYPTGSGTYTPTENGVISISGEALRSASNGWLCVSQGGVSTYSQGSAGYYISIFRNVNKSEEVYIKTYNATNFGQAFFIPYKQ